MSANPSARSRDYFIIKLGFLFVALVILFGVAAMRETASATTQDKPKHVIVEQFEPKNPPRHIQGIAKDLKDGDAKVNDSEKLLREVDVFGEQGVDLEIRCPQFTLPLMPELPQLPPKDILESVTKDQLNFILYQHIKAHQERTLEVRRRLYDAYDEYLDTCQ